MPSIIWTNAEILLIGPLETNVIEISIGIYLFFIQEIAFEKVCEMVSMVLAKKLLSGTAEAPHYPYYGDN